MKRIILPPPLPETGTRFSPDPSQIHHLKNVRRVHDGEDLEILDGVGGLARGKVHILKGDLHIQVVEELEITRESPTKICLAMAIPSHRKTIDLLLPALVQLGVWQIRIVETKYGGRLKGSKEKILQRTQKIAGESLKQCGRLVIPHIVLGDGFEQTCTTMERELEKNLIFHPLHEDGESSGEDAQSGPLPGGLGIFVGPEGGFSPQEVEFARGKGFKICDLGPRVLRMETAVVGICFWAQTAFGDLGASISI